MMDIRLLDAATSGDTTTMKDLAWHDPTVLLGVTPQFNTCLHISSMHGHERFCMEALVLNRALLSAVNGDEETPLLAAVSNGHTRLASLLLAEYCSDIQLSEAVLKQDKFGYNALHHAIRNGHRDLALELIAMQPALSEAVNNYDESPMFIAAMRNYVDVFEELLKNPNSGIEGPYGFNALHAAVRNSNSDIAKRIMETYPWLAREEEIQNNHSPIRLAVLWDKIDVLRVFLEHDRTLGYLIPNDGTPLLNSAAYRGHVGVARELLKYCPDAPYRDAAGWTCLHQAVRCNQVKFVEFVMASPQLRKLCNMRNSEFETVLHLAVCEQNPKMVTALLRRRNIDVTILDEKGNPANLEIV